MRAVVALPRSDKLLLVSKNADVFCCAAVPSQGSYAPSRRSQDRSGCSKRLAFPQQPSRAPRRCSSASMAAAISAACQACRNATPIRAAIAASTYAVVAMRVEFVPGVRVGAVATPVNVGFASGAFAARSVSILRSRVRIADAVSAERIRMTDKSANATADNVARAPSPRRVRPAAASASVRKLRP